MKSARTVRPRRPASKTGDVIAEFDGERVRSARHLSRLVDRNADGRTVKPAVMREGKRVDLTVTPEERPRRAVRRSTSPWCSEGSAGLKPGEPT